MGSYSRSMGAKGGVIFLNDRINNIVDDMIFSSFLSSDCWSTYFRFIRVMRIVLEQRTVFRVLNKLSKENAGTKKPANQTDEIYHDLEFRGD